MQIEDRVFKAEYGAGTVMHYQAGELYPVQVEFDEPYENGHSIYRFAAHELQPLTINEQPIIGRQRARVVKHRSGYNIGEEYLVAQSKHEPYFDVYTLDGQIRGSYINQFLEIIEPFQINHLEPVLDVLEVVQVNTSNDVETLEIEPIAAEIEHIAKGSKQLSIFDFI